MIPPGAPPQERASEMQVAAAYRAESTAFFAAAREPGRTPQDAAGLRASASDLRSLATSIERDALGLPALPPRGLIGP